MLFHNEENKTKYQEGRIFIHKKERYVVVVDSVQPSHIVFLRGHLNGDVTMLKVSFENADRLLESGD